ncbi:hypothetical protein ACU8OQ_12190 [Rhizobium leguminosarum]
MAARRASATNSFLNYIKFSAVRVLVVEERLRNSERPLMDGASDITPGLSCHERPHGGAGEFSAT